MAVIGLGLLGQLTVQVLRAAGCVVLGMDLAADRADLALRLGATAACTSSDKFHDLCLQHTGGSGADGVLITAETPSSDPVNLAGRIARDRAVVVAVGTVGMEIERKAYYEKELDFRLSRSYGPGRYDVAYEQKGRDYPIGHVRWAETRNMEAFLRLLADGKLDLQGLITHRFPIDRVNAAYDIINGRTQERFLGVLFTYPAETQPNQRLEVAPRHAGPVPGSSIQPVAIGLLGAGSFATSTLLPEIRKVAGIELVGVCTATGPHSRHAADKFGFRYCTTDENQLYQDSSINTLVVSTRHRLHARQVLAALAAGKHVFCEKPLCLLEEELAEIVRAYSRRQEERTAPVLMVGFNRRFAPMAVRMKSFLADLNAPLVMHYRVNAGSSRPTTGYTILNRAAGRPGTPILPGPGSGGAWSLTLDLLTTSNRRRGSMIVYHRYTEQPLQLDVNLLTSEFPVALADALDRIVGRAVELVPRTDQTDGFVEAAG